MKGKGLSPLNKLFSSFFQKGFWSRLLFLLYPLSLLLFQGCCSTCLRSKFFHLGQTDLCKNVEVAKHSLSFTEGDFACSGNWWDFFQDEKLKYFIELSLSCHPDIAIADSRVKRAAFYAMQNRSRLFPHLYLFSDVERERVSEFSTFVPGVFGTFTESQLKITTASYELDLWKKNRSLYMAAMDEIEAQKADYAEVQLILSTAIAEAYFDLQMNLKRKEINEARLAARKELLGLLKQQFDSGIIASFRLYETDTEVERIQDLIYQIEAHIDVDKHTLAALVGNLDCGCIDWDFAFNSHFSAFPLPCSLPFDLLARRPDIRAQLWRIESSKYYEYVAKVQFYPKFDLLAFAGFLSYFTVEHLFSNKSIEAIAKATGILPLFTAGKLKSELGIAHENLEIAIQKYNRLVLDAVKQASDAVTNLMYADKRLVSVEKSLKDAETLYNLTNQKFKNGIANRIALLNALENLFIQEDIEAEIYLARYESAVELIRAIGGGYYDSRCCSSE